jgi:choline/glycine/proline betaine transport protein
MVWATLVITIFFITSSDSGSLVDDMVTSGGHPNPPRAQRVFWAVSEGSVAATLLIVGGLRAIQNASISLGFFMSILLVLIAMGLYKALVLERRMVGSGVEASFEKRPWMRENREQPRGDS